MYEKESHNFPSILYHKNKIITQQVKNIYTQSAYMHTRILRQQVSDNLCHKYVQQQRAMIGIAYNNKKTRL